MKKILVMGANAARQKTLYFEKLLAGEVNRAAKMSEVPSGKGINFCRAVAHWGKCRAAVVQFAGGDNGRYLVDALRQEGMENLTVDCAAPLRCCITCIDRESGRATELIEPSGAATGDECDRFVRFFEENISSASGIAVCGSLPDGTAPELYCRVAAVAVANKLPLLLDLYKNVEPLLTLPETVLKINREELGKLTGCGDTAEGLKALFSRTGIKLAAITDGAGHAYASDGRILAEYSLPTAVRVANPIGCGDTASAVFFSELLEGADFIEAFKSALGAASANVESWIPAEFDPLRGREIAAMIEINTRKLI